MSDEFVFPVSSAQRRFWFMHAWDPTGIACNVPIGFRLRGPLNLDALERALQHIVQRHEALRTTFALQGDEPVQIVQAASVHGSFLRVHDLQALLPEAGAAEGRRIVADEIQRPFDLTRGPLLRALVVRLGSEDAVLVVTTHHIVCDGWGLGILVEELGAGYETGATGTSSGSAPLDIQYADYSLWQRQLEDERKADQLDTGAAAWTARRRHFRSRPITPGRLCPQVKARVVSFRFPSASWPGCRISPVPKGQRCSWRC